MYRKHLKIAVMLLALLGTLFTTAQASAAPVNPAGTDGTYGTTATPPSRMTPVPANGRVSCWGYYGTFKTGTHVMVVDWQTSSDECFGIATDRTIWHAWPNSNGWHRMPGGGHADFIYNLPYEQPDGFRMVPVFASSNGTYWCQNYYPATGYPSFGWTGDWYLCG
jgi:hypothetical protein